MRSSVAVLQNVEKLVLTLERGWAGKGKYVAVLKHLGLTKSKKVVEVPNTFEYRATAKKIEHLLRIETEEQHRSRIAADAAKRMPRPPLLIHHPPLQSGLS
eukprot:jgi/Ulvmu1/4338/UM002_0061.1